MSLNPQTARDEWIIFACNAVELAIHCKKMNILVGHYRTTKPHTLRIKGYRIQSNTKNISLSTG